MDYDWLMRLLSADIPSGELMDVINPSRVSQRSRVQQAKDRKWDQAHDAARGHYANRNALVLNHPMPPMWQSRSTPSPWDYNLPPAPAQAVASPMRVSPPQPSYPERGTARPPVMQAAPPPLPQRKPAPPPVAPHQGAAPKQATPQISPQDYYALLKAGMFRMG